MVYKGLKLPFRDNVVGELVTVYGASLYLKETVHRFEKAPKPKF